MKNGKRNQKHTKGVRGKMREDHFAAGGSVAEWRGKHAVHKNRKDRRSSRRTKDRDAINDSKEE